MPRLVIFAGGSGCRAITIALVRLGLSVTRVAPAWDSGGSSKIIREALGILPVGDIRHALMTIAHGEGRAGGVVKVFNTRLSDSEERTSLERELQFYMDGLHPSLQGMDSRLREAIIGYLRTFSSRVGQTFDLRGGSLGNFVLAGAFLAHGCDINAAIGIFRDLCAIRGNVWPASAHNDIHLRAELKNGEAVDGQDRITALDAAHSRIGIRDVRLVRISDGRQALEGAVQANGVVMDALAAADAIMFGPGSFYTSVLPHLLVGGISSAIAARRGIPKIFVGNMLECPETADLTLNQMLEAFWSCARRTTSGEPPLSAFVTHVLANRSPTPFQRSVRGRRYIAFDDKDPGLLRARIHPVAQDFEDPWQRGMHEASLVASIIARLSVPLSDRATK